MRPSSAVCPAGERNEDRPASVAGRGDSAAAHRSDLMWRNWIPFWQTGVSSYGGDIDLLFIGLLAISLGVALLLFLLLLVWAIRYRAGSKADRSHPVRQTWCWESGWTTVTLLGFL